MATENHTYDLLIVGAGPAGLSCAIEASNAGLDYLLIDKGSIVNTIQRFQRNMFFFSTPDLLEIGGIPFVVSTVRPSALDCANYYRRVADKYDLKCRFYEQILSVEPGNSPIAVRSSRGKYLTRAVVVATGYCDTPNPLNVPGESLPHVTHYYRDPVPCFRQAVLIVGGKNSAVEAALDLHRHGARVTVVHRGPALSSGVKYWILPDFENRVSDGSIRVHFNTIVNEFRPGSTTLRSTNGETREHPTDFAFILVGYRPNTEFLRSAGILVDPETLIPCHEPTTMETNVRNLYVAGGMVGGRFNNAVFIENGRGHGGLIVKSILSR